MPVALASFERAKLVTGAPVELQRGPPKLRLAYRARPDCVGQFSFYLSRPGAPIHLYPEAIRGLDIRSSNFYKDDGGQGQQQQQQYLNCKVAIRDPVTLAALREVQEEVLKQVAAGARQWWPEIDGNEDIEATISRVASPIVDEEYMLRGEKCGMIRVNLPLSDTKGVKMFRGSLGADGRIRDDWKTREAEVTEIESGSRLAMVVTAELTCHPDALRFKLMADVIIIVKGCLLYTSPSPRDS